MVVVIARRWASDLFAVALVALAAKIGYIASVTNLLALAVAQPLVGVPLFSGAAARGRVRRLPDDRHPVPAALRAQHRLSRRSDRRRPRAHAAAKLSLRHKATLVVFAAAVAMLIYGTRELKWGNVELAAFYTFVSIVTAVIGGPIRAARRTRSSTG